MIAAKCVRRIVSRTRSGCSESGAYVHGYHRRENDRLQDQAGTLVDLLHSDTSYPPGSVVLEATRPASRTGVHIEYRVLI